MSTYTLTVTRDELFEMQLALEARHEMLRERKRSIEDAGPDAFGGEEAHRHAVDLVRDRDKIVSTVHRKITTTRENSAALSIMLTGGDR